MDSGAYLRNVRVEEAEGGGHGQGQGGEAFIHQTGQVLQIKVAIAVRWYGLHLKTAHGSGCRICAVGRVRHQYSAPAAFAARVMIGSDHQQAGQFPLRPRHRS